MARDDEVGAIRPAVRPVATIRSMVRRDADETRP